MMRSSLFLILSVIFLSSCKDSTSGGGDTGGTTPASVGDVVPGKNTQYSFAKSQLDNSDHIIPGTTIVNGISAIVNDNGLSIEGKENTYFVFDDGDTAFYSFEKNGDVSVYFQNPNYYRIYGNPQAMYNEPLQVLGDIVFKRWITLPISSTKAVAADFFNETGRNITVSGTGVKADIQGKSEFISDTTVVTEKGVSLAAKHCRITLTSTIHSGIDLVHLNHTRDIWFVPKIGYIAALKTKTNMDEYKILVLPLDTTATLKVLTSYTLH
jgi:hypothetical protein